MQGESLLLSVRPIFVERILSGAKRIELRRVRPLVASGIHVLIYSSSPKMALVASAVVARVEVAAPAVLWQSVRADAGVTRAEYSEYFDGSGVAVALWLDDVVEFDDPVELAQLRKKWPWFRAPQSFRYVQARFDRQRRGVSALAPRAVAEARSPSQSSLSRQRGSVPRVMDGVTTTHPHTRELVRLAAADGWFPDEGRIDALRDRAQDLRDLVQSDPAVAKTLRLTARRRDELGRLLKAAAPLTVAAGASLIGITGVMTTADVGSLRDMLREQGFLFFCGVLSVLGGAGAMLYGGTRCETYAILVKELLQELEKR